MTTHANSSNRKSHAQILISTAIIGGASIVNIAFGIVRSKVVAVLLGPGGVGLMSLYNSILDITQALSNFGVQSSGVRQIAEAAGSDDVDKIARTATVLRRVSIILALLGAFALASLAEPVAEFTFGSNQHTTGVLLLAAAVFFRTISFGQAALIQGLRRIGDLARMNMLGTLIGTVVSIVFIYLFREQGIVPSLLVMTAISILTSWWFSRRAAIPSVRMTVSEMMPETATLLKLGMAFAASAVLTMGAAYAVRIIILRDSGFEAAGLYQAAWTLGGIYTGFILQAMGTDFYPRLTAAAQDNAQCNQLVNEQAQISMLIAGPGVMATLTLAPFVLTAFYSSQFQAGVGLVRWICLGMMLRVVAWPMGFIVLAKGAQKAFFWTEVAATVIHVGLAWLLVSRFGYEGAGAAFFALYVIHSFVIYAVVRRLSGFRWSPANLKLGLLFLPLAALTFGGFYLFSFWVAVLVGIIAVLLSGTYSLWSLLKIVPEDILPAVIRPWLARFT